MDRVTFVRTPKKGGTFYGKIDFDAKTEQRMKRVANKEN